VNSGLQQVWVVLRGRGATPTGEGYHCDAGFRCGSTQPLAIRKVGRRHQKKDGLDLHSKESPAQWPCSVAPPPEVHTGLGLAFHPSDDPSCARNASRLRLLLDAGFGGALGIKVHSPQAPPVPNLVRFP
jgi:hypothetical protein